MGQPKVGIRGEGIAAYCCAWLLKRAGCQVRLERTDRPRVPAILLSELALGLIRDVFARPDLFAELPQINRRVVAWGEGVAPHAFPHAGVVVSEELLLNSLWPGIGVEEGSIEGAADFTVLATRPLPGGVEERRFGTRRASAVEVRLRNGADIASCWIESFDAGWLFLIPRTPDETWLLAVGATPEALLEKSRLIAPRVEVRERRSAEFSSCPRIVAPLGGAAWLACGTAAMAFDPICGDGTAHAVREAILAAAAIRAELNGAGGAAIAHYSARLTAGFDRHLQLCREFYRTGGAGPWWRGEMAALEEGIAWCGVRVREHGEFRYRLDGFDLIPL